MKNGKDDIKQFSQPNVIPERDKYLWKMSDKDKTMKSCLLELEIIFFLSGLVYLWLLHCFLKWWKYNANMWSYHFVQFSYISLPKQKYFCYLKWQMHNRYYLSVDRVYFPLHDCHSLMSVPLLILIPGSEGWLYHHQMAAKTVTFNTELTYKLHYYMIC